MNLTKLRDNELTTNTATEKNKRMIELLEGRWNTENLMKIEFEEKADGSKGRWVAQSA
tara:strand:+ start:2423 stop:2596 length:174 start_codon:yes stop_codon:yes gene_type:complete